MKIEIELEKYKENRKNMRTSERVTKLIRMCGIIETEWIRMNKEWDHKKENERLLSIKNY